MNPTSFPARTRLQAVASIFVLTGLLAACGGGGSAGGSETPAGFAHFEGTVTDSTGAPMVDAEIRLPFGTNAYWGDTTNDKGKFSFDARASDYAGVTPVVMMINKEGYRPRTVFYTSVSNAASYTYTSTPTSAPVKLAAGEIVPKNSAGLWHSGNDEFGGSVNSRLQMAAQGTGFVFEVAAWTPALKSQYSRATVTFLARGVEADCRDTVGLSDGVAYPLQYLGGSSTDGNFSAYSLTYDISSMAAGKTMVLVIKSGGSCAAGDPADDFEFSEVLVTLKP